MSKLRDFIEKIPALCGADQADIRGLRNILIFDYEIENKKSVLARENFKDDPDSRLDVLFDFEGNEDKKNFCRILLNIKMYMSYGDEGKVAENITLLENSTSYPEITTVYSVSDATASSGALIGWY